MHGTCRYFYNRKLFDVVSMATDVRIESNNLSVSQTSVPFTWCIVSPEPLDDLWPLLCPLICIWASGGSRLLSMICFFKVWSVSDCLWPAGSKSTRVKAHSHAGLSFWHGHGPPACVSFVNGWIYHSHQLTFRSTAPLHSFTT